VLIRQFRLPAHLANGHGDLVEFVAGRVEAGESLAEAARRECTEEIGIAPSAVAELFTFLSTPGVTDEEITLFVAAVDAASVREGALTTPDGEHVYVDHRVAMAGAQPAAHSRIAGLGHALYGRDFTSRRIDTCDRFHGRLDRHHHVMGICMDQGLGIAGDGDVTLPEQEIAAA
jgi:ADP-ribose pyrophosphatase YjhB (NUDIX family)